MTVADLETIRAAWGRAAGRVFVVTLPVDPLPWRGPGLTAAETDRAGRFQRLEDRQAFILGRTLTRGLCYGDARLEPFHFGPQGKPFLPNAPGFNLSHSGGRLALALGPSPHLGIDIEAGRGIGEGATLVDRVLHPAEAAYWRDAADRRAAFLRAWTRKEALMKAQGVSRLDTLREIDTRLDLETPVLDGLCLYALPGPLAGAVAVPEEFGPPEILCL